MASINARRIDAPDLRVEAPTFRIRPHAITRAARWFADEWPGATFYAVKANPEPWAIEAVLAGGIDRFDVASLREVRDVRVLAPTATLAFMHPDHPSVPPGPETFDGKGMILTVQVADAAATYERMDGSDVPIVHPLTDEAWGQRRFMVRDPAGVLVDVVEQIEPEAGYWDQYMAR